MICGDLSARGGEVTRRHTESGSAVPVLGETCSTTRDSLRMVEHANNALRITLRPNRDFLVFLVDRKVIPEAFRAIAGLA